MKNVKFIGAAVAILLAYGPLPATTYANLEGMPFTDYGSGTTTELAVGGALWQINWGQGPWTWFPSSGPPLLDTNVHSILDLHATAAADISADLVATLPIAGTMTLSAHAEGDEDVIVGTMVLSGTGINAIDINASRVLVDEENGMCMAPFHPHDPKLTVTLAEVTGVFANIQQVGDWELYLAGSYAAPLIEGLALQDNIFAALSGDVPLIGGLVEVALTGQYVPEPATVLLLGVGGLALLRKTRA